MEIFVQVSLRRLDKDILIIELDQDPDQYQDLDRYNSMGIIIQIKYSTNQSDAVMWERDIILTAYNNDRNVDLHCNLLRG